MDKFRLIRPLGKGSFGSALLVEDVLSRKLCVIKKVPLNNLNNVEREEAMREVAVLSQMKHPNIISYHTSFEENNHLHIVTDYCNGGDLHSKIQGQKGSYFSEEQVLDWFVQICLAVKHVHDQRVLHRDIKTQNIFLTQSGIAKLGDFGIARMLNNTSELAKTCIGTPYYLSPEICENKPYNNKSDVWSLGCVLYEIITLRHAFEAKNIKNLVFKIIRGSLPPIPDKYSPELRSLLSEIFVRNPNDRPSVNTILRKHIILPRIWKFLNQSELREEFCQVSLSKHVMHVKGNPKRTDVTKPSTKYGVSIASRKIQKSALRTSRPNRELSHCLKCKCHPKPPLVQKTKDKNGSKDSHCKFPKQSGDNSSSSSSEIVSTSENRTDFSNSIKSIVDISAVKLSDKSSEISVSLTAEFPKLSEGVKFSLPDPQLAPVAKDADENPCCNNTSTNYFADNQLNTAINVNLPLIKLSGRRRSRWSKDKVDVLKDLPLELTASKMEATLADDKMIVFQKRPQSAPNFEHKKHLRRESSVPSLNCLLQCASTIRNHSNSSKLVSLEQRDTERKSNVKSFEISQLPTISCVEQIPKNINISCACNKTFTINSFDEIKNKVDQDTVNGKTFTKAGCFGFPVISSIEESVECITTDNNFLKSDYNFKNGNKDKTYVLFKNSENVSFHLPRVPENTYVIRNHDDFQEIEKAIQKDPVLTESKQIATSLNKADLQNSELINNKSLLKESDNSNPSENGILVDEFVKNNSEQTNNILLVNGTSNCNHSQKNTLIDEFDTSSVGSKKNKEESENFENTFRSDVGIQCDILLNANQQKSTVLQTKFCSCNPTVVQQRFSQPKKQTKVFLSLPDLRNLSSRYDEGSLYPERNNSPSSYSMNIDNFQLSDCETFMTALTGQAEEFQMSQEFNVFLRQMENLDCDSEVSLLPEGDNTDLFADIEQLRIDLENKHGLEIFLRAYKELHSILENGSLLEDGTTANQISDHFRNEVLNLIIKEETYLSSQQSF